MRAVVLGAALTLIIAGVSTSPATSSPMPALSFASDRTLVSEPGHRISEFSVATNPRNPNHIVVAAMDWDDDRGSIGCTTYISRDGGLSWNPGGDVPGYDEAFQQLDPWVTIDRQGRVHLQCLSIVGDLALYGVGAVDGTTGRPSVVQVYSRSDDGGDTWSPAQRLPSRHKTNHVDKNAIFASSSGTLYACYADYPQKGDDLVVSRSFDAGETWTRPKDLDAVIGIDRRDGEGGFGTCNGFAEGRNGEVHVLWYGYFSDGTRYGTATTTDDGKTWRSATIGEDLNAGAVRSRAGGAPAGSWPAITSNPRTGEIFVTTQAWVEDHYEATLYRSTDAGTSYEELDLPEITSAGCQGCHEMRPAATVDGAGRLGLQIMLTSDRGLTKETWFLVSPDGGNDWLDPVQVSATGPNQWWGDPRNWTPNGTGALSAVLNRPQNATGVVGWQGVARVGAGGPVGHHINYGGDYWNVAASAKGFVALWEDNAEDGRHQLFARVLRVTRGESADVPRIRMEMSTTTRRDLADADNPSCSGPPKSYANRADKWHGPEIAALADVRDSKLVSVQSSGGGVDAVLASTRSVRATMNTYRQALSEIGVDFPISDFEGFEAELFGSSDSKTVLVKILRQCWGSVGIVTLAE